MKPIKTPISDVVYRGQEAETGDLWVHRVQPGQVLVIYELTEEEREALLNNGKVCVWVCGEPISPMAVEVHDEPWTEKIAENPFKVIEELNDKERQMAVKDAE